MLDTFTIESLKSQKQYAFSEGVYQVAHVLNVTALVSNQVILTRVLLQEVHQTDSRSVREAMRD